MKTTWISIQALEKRLGIGAVSPHFALAWLGHSMTRKGALSDRFKAMLALAICIAARRADSISDHLQDALKKGASRQEILEVIEIGMLMGGDRSIRYGAEAISLLEDHEVA